MKKLVIILTIYGLFCTGCEDNKNDENNQSIEEPSISSIDTVITHDIDALNASGFYFNLISSTEVDSANTWHLSFQMIPVTFGEATYMMPSLILGETTYTAEYTDVLFEELQDTPDSFMSDYFQDASVVQYSGPNEVLQYDMQTHTVSVKDAGRVFVFYELENHSTYKIQFIEYVSGVIAFRHDSL